MNPAQNFLIPFQDASTERDVLEHFTEKFGHLNFSIWDMHYLNFHSSLSLLSGSCENYSTYHERRNSI